LKGIGPLAKQRRHCFKTVFYICNFIIILVKYINMNKDDLKKFIVFFLVIVIWIFLGLPKNWNSKVEAADYKMQTGYYVGDGDAKSITNLGFTPEMVILKSDTNTIATVFRTRTMPDNVTAYLGTNTANSTAGFINFDTDGFTITSTANTANVRFTWIAFAGSDCTSNGSFCIGTYIGNGSSPRTISTGFDPDLVWVKQSTGVYANWRSSAMDSNVGQYFGAVAQDTSGALFTTIGSGGFTVGATNNANAGIYYYAAFKSGAVAVGTYTGNGTTQSVTGLAFQPNWVFVKNANAGTAVSGVHNVQESYGSSSSYYSNTANIADSIKSINSDGFTVGAHATANGNTNTIFWAAFSGTMKAMSSSGTFKMTTGSYTGDGQYKIISGLTFKPDLVIIKGSTTEQGVFRTSMMAGDTTAYFATNLANFAGGVVNINEDGFTVGNSTTVNTSGITYYWTAYGNAWKASTNSGASDFLVGAYYGNSVDDRNISRLPFQPDLVVTKPNAGYYGTWKSSAQSGDLSGFFHGNAEAANYIQSLRSDGFQLGIGTLRSANYLAYTYFYFAFKTGGGNFVVGTYNGTGSSNYVNTVGFQPDHLWVKHTGSTRGVLRTSTLSGDGAFPFINVGSLSDAITSLNTDGFTVNTAAETNTSGTNNYRYVAWKDGSITQVVVSISISDKTVDYGFLGGSATKDTIDPSQTQIITNNGSGAEDFDIKGQNASGGGCTWDLITGVPGQDEYKQEFSTNAGGNWTAITTNYGAMSTGIAKDGTVNLDLKITMPSISTCFQGQSVDVTIQASEN
jgi:hypothetical protein